MPPRFAYWTIILDGTPTSFRARDREELLPTFNQLRQKNPAAMMKWFSQGRLWDSPEAAREERERLRTLEGAKYLAERRERERLRAEAAVASALVQGGRPPRVEGGRLPPREFESPGPPPKPQDQMRPPRPRDRRPPGGPPGGEKRGRDWRPGGEHQDPRDKYKGKPGDRRKRWKARNLGPGKPGPAGTEPSGSGKPFRPPRQDGSMGSGAPDARKRPPGKPFRPPREGGPMGGGAGDTRTRAPGKPGPPPQRRFTPRGPGKPPSRRRG